MKTVRKITLGTVALVTALGGSVLGAGPAAAHGPLTVNCTNGKTYVVESNGNGDYTPARDVNSNTVLVPVGFGAFTGTITDADGNVVDSFTDPASSKGSGKQKSDATCSFNITETSDGSDPEFPAGFTFTGSGTVLVKITPGGPRG